MGETMGGVEVISFLRGLTSAWVGVTKFSPSQAPTRVDEILPVCFKPRPRSEIKKILARVKFEPNVVVTKIHQGVGPLTPKCTPNPIGLW